jgi:hypothetical protein
VLLLQVIWGIPMATLFVWKIHAAGTLTILNALWIILVSSVGALIVALLFWFTTTRPRLRVGVPPTVDEERRR